ncbi:hypothetical protein SLS58_005819 [Diplodia intermedia]|uniref:Uncharacterized protein n=1 Tax=Diplodia intermedia TaxID=856260 RepID=A0ABR3TPX9_9PEZI
MKEATYAESDPESDEETWDVKSCISIRPKEEGAWDTGVLPNTSECETLLEWNTGELTWEPMSLNLHNDHIAQDPSPLTPEDADSGYFDFRWTPRLDSGPQSLSPSPEVDDADDDATLDGDDK